MLAVACLAQDQPEPRRQFAVASIKPNLSGKRALQNYKYAGDRFEAENATLVDMIVRAYPTRRIQMQGGPDWIDTDRFDVVAKADPSDGAVTSEQWPQMVQRLLEDRFLLRFHIESKEMPVLALVPARTGAVLPPVKPAGATSMTPGEHNQMIFKNITMAGLVNVMSNALHVPVVDRSGIAGFYDFTLDPLRYSELSRDDAARDTANFGDLLAIAVREQLGLQLEKQKAPLDVTVIDRAQRPTAN